MLVKIYTAQPEATRTDRAGTAVSCIIPIETEIFTRKSFPQDTKRQRITGWN